MCEGQLYDQIELLLTLSTKGCGIRTPLRTAHWYEDILSVHGTIFRILRKDHQWETCHLFGVKEGDRTCNASWSLNHGCKSPDYPELGCTLSYTIQFFCVPALESVRKISKKPVKIYAWMSGQASFMIYPFAPKHFGGRGDLRPQVMEQIAKGKSFEDASYEVGHNWS